MNIIRLQLTLSIAFTTACAGLLTRTTVRLPWLHFKTQFQMNHKVIFTTSSNKTACQNNSFFSSSLFKICFFWRGSHYLGVSDAVYHGTWSFRYLTHPYWTTHIKPQFPTFTARSGLVTRPTRKHVHCPPGANWNVWDVFVVLRENPKIMTLELLAHDIDLNASIVKIITTEFQY